MPLPHINDRYMLLSNPRQGGMADVYKAIDMHRDGRQVALKVFKNGKIEEDILAESFRREAQALKELKHPNIVEFWDSDQNSQTGESFLVLEWIEQSLSSVLKESPIEGWDSYWELVGLPILTALAFSHERQYVHRDLKPSNILVGSDGQFKLADFGISKLRGYFRPTVTLREFSSRPFTPQEIDDGSYSYTRDVFGFGVVTLNSLTDVELTDYDSIAKAIEELDAPPEIIKIIEQAVSTEPAERHSNAEVLLAELNATQQKRLRKQSFREDICYLRLTHSALKNLKDGLDLPEHEIHKAVIEDLNAGCAVSKFSDSAKEAKASEEKLSIYGFSYRYLAAIEEDCLVIISAQNFSSAVLEQSRERYWQPPYKFKLSKPVVKGRAEEVIRKIRLAVESHEADWKTSQAENQKQRLFHVWSDILRAKTDWEKGREEVIQFTSATLDGNRVVFRLSEPLEEDAIGQSRYVARPNGSSILKGFVEKVVGDELTLYIKHGEPSHLKNSGELLFDTQLAEIALNRQKYALDAIRYDRAVRSDLRELLAGSSEIAIQGSIPKVNFVQSLNESQKEAVQTALSEQDFLLLKGPPGTGKTTFITEVILQTLIENPNARILLSSQTHVALDNALEKLQALKSDLRLVRIGNHERVADSVRPLLIEEQMEQWRESAITKGHHFVGKWAADRGISPENLKKAALCQMLRTSAIKIAKLRAELAEQKQCKDQKFPAFQNEEDSRKKRCKKSIPLYQIKEFQELTEEIEQVKTRAKKARDEQKQVAKRLEQVTDAQSTQWISLSLDELEQQSKGFINPDTPAAKMLQRLVNLQTEWFELFGRNEEFNPALIRRTQVVAGTCIGIAREISDVEFDLCIVDEASKATATEVLVPMARSKRWILVGDPKQLPPFLDGASHKADFLEKYNLEPEDVRQTLFDRLLETLPASCRKMLTIQHRMVEPIGRLISACFYENELDSNGPVIDEDLSDQLPRPVTWITTSRLQSNQEQSCGSSFANACEVAEIAKWLKQLNKTAGEHQKSYSVAVLSGYASQLESLNRTLNAEHNEMQSLKVECNTIDAFQGREADIVIYSVTRSNKNKKIGFLKDEARLNVALSRGRLGLVIVGDHHFCRALDNSPLQRVLNYIEQHPEDCSLKELK